MAWGQVDLRNQQDQRDVLIVGKIDVDKNYSIKRLYKFTYALRVLRVIDRDHELRLDEMLEEFFKIYMGSEE